MMIMGPPQWGQGRARADGSASSSVLISGGGIARSWRARAMLSARALLAKRP